MWGDESNLQHGSQQFDQQPRNSRNSANSFDIQRFIERQQRDTARLAKAAWGVGATHKWFRHMTRDLQVQKSSAVGG